MNNYQNDLNNLRCRMFSQNEPSPLHHYTDLQSLIGIIDNKEIWFTNIEYLNDVSEFNEGKHMFLEKLNLKKDTFICSKTFDAIQSVINTDVTATDYFSFSLSQESDSLDQWRAYSNHECGVMISFVNIFNHLDEVGVTKIKIIYDDEDFGNLIDIVIKTMVGWKFDFENQGANIFWFWGYLQDFLVKFFLSKKHKSFKNENEWKLIYTHREVDDNHREKEDVVKQNIRYRVRDDYIIPYSVFDMKKMKRNDPTYYVQKVLVCPLNKGKQSDDRNSRTFKGIENLLKKNKIDNFENKVFYSNLPYR